MAHTYTQSIYMNSIYSTARQTTVGSITNIAHRQEHERLPNTYMYLLDYTPRPP